MMHSILTLFGELFEFFLVGSFQGIERLSGWLSSYWHLSTFGQTFLFFCLYLILFLVFQVIRNRINFRSEQKFSIQLLGNRRLSVLAGIGVTIQLFALVNFFITRDIGAIGAVMLIYSLYMLFVLLYLWQKAEKRQALIGTMWLIGFIQIFSISIYIVILYFYMTEGRKMKEVVGIAPAKKTDSVEKKRDTGNSAE